MLWVVMLWRNAKKYIRRLTNSGLLLSVGDQAVIVGKEKTKHFYKIGDIVTIRVLCNDRIMPYYICSGARGILQMVTDGDLVRVKKVEEGIEGIICSWEKRKKADKRWWE